MRVLYIGGFNETTDGSWATGPVVEKLRQAQPGVEVISDNTVDYPILHGFTHPPTEAATDVAAQNLADYLNGLPEDDCFVLVGYSAGVVAIEKALSSGGPELDSNVGPRILGIEQFGDPTNLEHINVPLLFPTLPHEVGPEYKGRTVLPVCNEGDILCAGFSTEDADACQTGDLANFWQCIGVKPHLPPAYTKAAETTAEELVNLVLGECAETPSHPVASGDTLWDLAERYYGDGNKWRTIYDANRSLIEDTATEHGFASSDDGHWIFPGTPLTIPPTA